MLPSPAKRAWTMNPRPEWVVTVRMTGTSTETYPADRCATAPHAALSLQNPQHRLLPREGTHADRRAGCYSLTADDDAAADEPPPCARQECETTRPRMVSPRTGPKRGRGQRGCVSFATCTPTGPRRSPKSSCSWQARRRRSSPANTCAWMGGLMGKGAWA
jgi:hypothetical protein